MRDLTQKKLDLAQEMEKEDKCVKIHEKTQGLSFNWPKHLF